MVTRPQGARAIGQEAVELHGTLLREQGQIGVTTRQGTRVAGPGAPPPDVCHMKNIFSYLCNLIQSVVQAAY